MDLALLQTLKQKLDESRDLRLVWEYFLDQFGEDDEFLQLGEDPENAMLSAAIEETGRRLYSRPVQILDPCLRRIAGHGFIHGSVFMEGLPVTVIYFEEAHKGLLCVVRSFDPPETQLVRFTSRPLYQSLNRSNN